MSPYVPGELLGNQVPQVLPETPSGPRGSSTGGEPDSRGFRGGGETEIGGGHGELQRPRGDLHDGPGGVPVRPLTAPPAPLRIKQEAVPLGGTASFRCASLWFLRDGDDFRSHVLESLVVLTAGGSPRSPPQRGSVTAAGVLLMENDGLPLRRSSASRRVPWATMRETGHCMSFHECLYYCRRSPPSDHPLRSHRPRRPDDSSDSPKLFVTVRDTA